MALKRLTCKEGKMARDKEFGNQHSLKNQEYVRKWYGRTLKGAETTGNLKEWYLPHFAVCKLSKTDKTLSFRCCRPVSYMSQWFSFQMSWCCPIPYYWDSLKDELSSLMIYHKTETFSVFMILSQYMHLP